jgi:hypothetical protein
MKLKKLQVGDQSFAEMVNAGCMYIDKTKEVYELVKEPRGRYFLSRPRRFGKSLTCSTLSAIFEGRKELFNTLWIGTSDYSWEKHPIIHIDFSELTYDTPKDLRESLHEELDQIASTYGITSNSKFLKTKLKNLIVKLNEKHGSTAVIIDEYDKPITEHIDKPKLAEQMQTILRSFYGTFKGKSLDKHLHFLFITGVSKFSKVSLFSEVNNLKDITLDARFATIVGYTQQEIELYFTDYIKRLAESEQISYEQMLIKLKTWYNGFCFSPDGKQSKVYNPVSLHNCFDSQRFSNYWFATGTPSFLIKIFKKNYNAVKQFVTQDAWEIVESEMEAFAPEVYYKKIMLLLLQTGYLTINKYIPFARIYELDYANYEVRLSMTEQIMEYVAHLPRITLSKFIVRFAQALQADDINEYCTAFREYLKLIPHNIIVDREKFFQSTFFGTAMLVDANAIVSEVATDRGFVDIVLHGTHITFVMEFKKDKTPEEAMRQILEKKYYEKYLIQGKQVTLVGINFDVEDGIEVAWTIKNLDDSTSATPTQ